MGLMMIIIQLFAFRSSMRLGGDPFPPHSMMPPGGGSGFSPRIVPPTTIPTTTPASGVDIRRRFTSGGLPSVRSAPTYSGVWLRVMLLLPGVLVQWACSNRWKT